MTTTDGNGWSNRKRKPEIFAAERLILDQRKSPSASRLTATEVGKATGAKLPTIIKVANRLGVELRKGNRLRTADALEQIIRDQAARPLQKRWPMSVVIDASAEVRETIKNYAEILGVKLPKESESLPVCKAREMLSGGSEIENIAEATGLPAATIERLATARLNRIAGRTKQPQRAKALALLGKGERIGKVAGMTGLNISTVRRIRNSAESGPIDARRNSHTLAAEALIREQDGKPIEKRLSVTDICQETGADESTVSALAKRVEVELRKGNRAMQTYALEEVLREQDVLPFENRLPISVIVDATESSRQIVKYNADRLGVELPHEHRSEPVRRAKRMLRSGTKAVEVTDSTGLSRKSVARFHANRLTRSQMQTKPKGKSRRPLRIENDWKPGLYRGDNGLMLLVPTRKMSRRHDAARPINVARRAGVLEEGQTSRPWERWIQDFAKASGKSDAAELFISWLYHELSNTELEQKAGVKLVPPSNQRNRRAAAGEFFLTPDMIRFREQSTDARIGAAAGTSTKVGETFVARHADEGWLESWQSRGAEPPDNVMVVTDATVERCAAAWDAACILRGMASRPSYQQWFDKLFPWTTLDVLFGWASWLYGGAIGKLNQAAPDGWLIVDEFLARLAERLSPSGICRAAKIDKGNLSRLWRNPTKRTAIRRAILAANGAADRESLENDQKAARTPRPSTPGAEGVVARFAEAATLRSALADAGMQAQTLSSWLERNVALGDYLFGDLLAPFDDGSPVFRRKNRPRYGVVGPGLFRPPPQLVTFKVIANSLWTEHNITRIRRSMPCDQCFQLWFLDNVMPDSPRAVHSRSRKLLNEAMRGIATADSMAKPSERAEARSNPSQAKRKAKRRGPSPNELTSAMYEYCYVQLAAGSKRAAIAARIKSQFGVEVKNSSQVTIYAKRHATNKDTLKPWPVPRG